jgi:4-hydroxy-tetrahydrodipicolinate reductase
MNRTKYKVAMIGAGGRMGKAIVQVLSHSENMVLSYAIEKKDSILIGMDSGLNSGLKDNHVPYTFDIEESISNSDISIDFSSHYSTEEVINSAVKFQKPIVIGCTGHTEDQNKLIKQASEKIPIIHSPNMSVGVNLLFKLVELASKALGDRYDVELLDIHHRHKKDAPSGTAVALKKILLNSLERNESDVIYGRHGISGERDTKQIAVHTMRAGEVVGEHTVYFVSSEERIELKHRAEDRKTFAVGAVKAAEFLIQKQPGFYSMFDVLGI